LEPGQVWQFDFKKLQVTWQLLNIFFLTLSNPSSNFNLEVELVSSLQIKVIVMDFNELITFHTSIFGLM